MAKEIMTAQQKGAALIKNVASVDFKRVPVIRPQGKLIDEFSQQRTYDAFVRLPAEIADLFPGSYIDPTDFLKALMGVSENVEQHKSQLLGDTEGTVHSPVFSFEQSSNNSYFTLKVQNGITNANALKMSKLAFEAGKLEKGFADQGMQASSIRAQYQDAMKSNIENALCREESERESGAIKNYAVRIHDDCGATGESVVNYLLASSRDPGVLEKYRKRGVKVVIDGPVTAQAALYMKSFSEQFDISMDIDAGHMAFGLTEGVLVEGKRQHANYITYPEKLVHQLPSPAAREMLGSYKKETGEDPQVVGDMGEAEKGIEAKHMEAIRQEMSPYGQDYCIWNEERSDTWGSHPKHEEGIAVKAQNDANATDYVYLARGGYIPYIFDQLYNRNNFERGNIVILRASRFSAADETTGEEYGFGVGFGIPEGVRVG